MTSEDPRARARRLCAWWGRLQGADLFRAIICDLQVATAASGGTLLLHGAKRPLVAAASDVPVAQLDSLRTDRLSPGARSLLTGTAVRIDDLSTGAHEADPWCALARASRVVAVLAIPLRVRSGTVAAVTLFAPNAGHFTARRISAAEAIGSQAALTVLTELTRDGIHRTVDPRSAVDLGEHRVAVALRGGSASETSLRMLRGMANLQAQHVLGDD
ncbi:MAG: GAF domain-containing protein [Actinobacteria bacterium]|nr:GAF domain-containing protein [Actinomycetota bacterium]